MEKVRNVKKKELKDFEECTRCNKIIRFNEGICLLCFKIVGKSERNGNMLISEKLCSNRATAVLCWECYYELENDFVREIRKPYHNEWELLKLKMARRFLEDEFFMGLETDKEKYDYMRKYFTKEWTDNEVRKVLEYARDLNRIETIHKQQIKTGKWKFRKIKVK
ncbi:hypothetical protein CCP3SC1AL1_520007 [Gammaproteobacteria bacterium]